MSNVHQLRTLGRRAFEAGEPPLGIAEPSDSGGFARLAAQPGVSAVLRPAPTVGGRADGRGDSEMVRRERAMASLSDRRPRRHLLAFQAPAPDRTRTLPSGAKVHAVIRSGSRGAQVVRVIEVDTTTPSNNRSGRSDGRPDASTAVALTGQLMWFDGARGFGFVASDDFGRDVFVHTSILGPAGVSTLIEGQAVSMRVVETPKGREAIAISL